MFSSDRTHTASRPIAAEPQALYQAFMSPEALVRWLPPDGAAGEIEILESYVGGRLRMKLTFVSSVGKSSEGSDLVEARFVDPALYKRIGLSVRFLSDDPQFSGPMTMTWRLERTPNGTLVTVVADNVPSGIGRVEHEPAIASTLANLADFVEQQSAAKRRQRAAKRSRGSN
jgi:uncharacterized protein YndB with AHSA1/START domain